MSKLKITLSTFAIVAVLLISLPAKARILLEKVESPKKVAFVKIVERINYDEDEEFEKILETLKAEGYLLKNNSIVFNTPGGNAHAAKLIGKIIRQRKLNTYLAPNSVCGSACIYGLIGGVVRNVYGTVSVHRSSFSVGVPLEKIKKFSDWSDAAAYKHVYEMGISHLLTDAIMTTPHWGRRYLTETELRRWSINATDKMYEELSMRAIAAESKTSIDDVQDSFYDLRVQCEPQVKEFKTALWDCFRVNYLALKLGKKPSEIAPKTPNYLIQNIDYTKSGKVMQFN